MDRIFNNIMKNEHTFNAAMRTANRMITNRSEWASDLKTKAEYSNHPSYVLVGTDEWRRSIQMYEELKQYISRMFCPIKATQQQGKLVVNLIKIIDAGEILHSKTEEMTRKKILLRQGLENMSHLKINEFKQFKNQIYKDLIPSKKAYFTALDIENEILSMPQQKQKHISMSKRQKRFYRTARALNERTLEPILSRLIDASFDLNQNINQELISEVHGLIRANETCLELLQEINEIFSEKESTRNLEIIKAFIVNINHAFQLAVVRALGIRRKIKRIPQPNKKGEFSVSITHNNHINQYTIYKFKNKHFKFHMKENKDMNIDMLFQKLT